MPEKAIPVLPSWPHFSADEQAAVMEVLQSGKVNYWTSDKVNQFEQAFADYHQVNHAVAVANGTLALELALRALNIGQGDEVLVPCRTFVASALAVVAVGATPVFVDIEPENQNVSVQTLTAGLTKKTKALIVVHLNGWPAPMLDIMPFANSHNLKVIEDCAQAHGAAIGEQLVGSFGDAAAFSFCQDKIISTGGEGGMLLVNDSEAYQRAWSYKDHGKNRAKCLERHDIPRFRWVHDGQGSNWRMTAMQAAIGLAQLQKLSDWLGIRKQHADSYRAALSSCDSFYIPEPKEPIRHAYYKFNLRLTEQSPLSQLEILQQLKQRGVPAFSGSCPQVQREQVFTQGKAVADFPNAKILEQSNLQFLLHPTLAAADIDWICSQILDVLS